MGQFWKECDLFLGEGTAIIAINGERYIPIISSIVAKSTIKKIEEAEELFSEKGLPNLADYSTNYATANRDMARFLKGELRMVELRPCIFRIMKKSKANEEIVESHKGYFHEWGQETVGELTACFGIVECKDGTVYKVLPEDIAFTDRD